MNTATISPHPLLHYWEQIKRKQISKSEAYWQIGKWLIDHPSDSLVSTAYQLNQELIVQRRLSPNLLKKWKIFYQVFPNWELKMSQLSWTHYQQLLRLKQQAQQQFYLHQAIENNWTNLQLTRQLNTSFKERTISLSVPDQLIQLREPYVFEFIHHTDTTLIKEKDLEEDLVQNMPQLLLELGNGFSFIAQQQRLQLPSGKQFYVDLVFYQHQWNRFVIFDLKITELRHQDIGQMDLYIRLFDQQLASKQHHPTIGIILCPIIDPWLKQYSAITTNPQLFAQTYSLKNIL